MSQENLKVCHVVANLNEDTGGPAYTVTALADELSRANVQTELVSLDYAHLGAVVSPGSAQLHITAAASLAINFRGCSPWFQRKISDVCAGDVQLVHNHGLWMFPNYYARRAALRHSLPLVTSPRGMLESWSLSRSRCRKLLAWHAYEKKNLQSVSAFHATADAECSAIRKAGFSQPVAVIPNGIHAIDPSRAIEGREVLEDRFSELKDKKWILFLSRIHPKKGVDLLIDAWRELSVGYPGWHLLIAGSDLIGYEKKLQKQVSDHGLESRVSFTGMLRGSEKNSALANAEFMVLPTHSENFGVVVAESLAYGTPVITTDGAPWMDLETHACGWWIENELDALGNAMKSAMDLSTEERAIMGARGKSLVEEKYTWSSIAKSMAQLYRWIIDGGEQPRFIDC